MSKIYRKKRKIVYICIPTYNEAENILKLLEKLNQVQRLVADQYKLLPIIIDDNSPDGTAKIVHNFQNKNIIPKVLSNNTKQGLGPAYIKAFTYAIQRSPYAIITMDADLSHDPFTLPAMLKALKNHDLVIGSRYTKGGSTRNWKKSRQLLSKYGNLYSKTILNLNINDLTGGFNAYKLEALKNIPLTKLQSNGYFFQIELKYKILKKGFTFIEIPITFTERETGQSKLNTNIITEAIIAPIRLRINTNDR